MFLIKLTSFDLKLQHYRKSEGFSKTKFMWNLKLIILHKSYQVYVY